MGSTSSSIATGSRATRTEHKLVMASGVALLAAGAFFAARTDVGVMAVEDARGSLGDDAAPQVEMVSVPEAVEAGDGSAVERTASR